MPKGGAITLCTRRPGEQKIRPAGAVENRRPAVSYRVEARPDEEGLWVDSASPPTYARRSRRRSRTSRIRTGSGSGTTTCSGPRSFTVGGSTSAPSSASIASGTSGSSTCSSRSPTMIPLSTCGLRVGVRRGHHHELHRGPKRGRHAGDHDGRRPRPRAAPVAGAGGDQRDAQVDGGGTGGAPGAPGWAVSPSSLAPQARPRCSGAGALAQASLVQVPLLLGRGV